MKLSFSFLFIILFNLATAQQVQTYINEQGDTHLCGAFPLEQLQKDTTYQKWFNEFYNTFDLPEGDYKWKKALANTTVDIYLGTWCGDSKRWVPSFIKLWDQLGLDRKQLNFIALYDIDEKYKQGPNGEEKGLNIHRVPTFIFKKEEEEYARIVEYPVNDLTTDLAQIALGYPSEPNYRAATYFMELLETTPIDTIKKDLNKPFYEVYNLVGKSRELNTLGYVYLHAGKIEEAKMVFMYNRYLFRHEPNVYDSYAEALAISGDKEAAIENYEHVLKLDPANENARAKLDELKKAPEAEPVNGG